MRARVSIARMTGDSGGVRWWGYAERDDGKNCYGAVQDSALRAGASIHEVIVRNWGRDWMTVDNVARLHRLAKRVYKHHVAKDKKLYGCYADLKPKTEGKND